MKSALFIRSIILGAGAMILALPGISHSDSYVPYAVPLKSECSYQLSFIDDIEYTNTIRLVANTLTSRGGETAAKLTFPLNNLEFAIFVRQAWRTQAIGANDKWFFDQFVTRNNSLGLVDSGTLELTPPDPSQNFTGTVVLRPSFNAGIQIQVAPHIFNLKALCPDVEGKAALTKMADSLTTLSASDAALARKVRILELKVQALLRKKK